MHLLPNFIYKSHWMRIKLALHFTGCRIFLLGFDASEMRRLVNLVRDGGGTRHMEMNETITHVILGSPPERYLQKISVLRWDVLERFQLISLHLNWRQQVSWLCKQEDPEIVKGGQCWVSQGKLYLTWFAELVWLKSTVTGVTFLCLQGNEGY